MIERPLVAGQNVMEKIMGIARNVEIWIFGAFGALVLAACLEGKQDKPQPASQAGVAPEVELAQPQPGVAEPMYVVYVVGKRPSAAEKKRIAQGRAG
ncbi:hypothetical protein [Massilia sp. Leaf139]|uniref:hypothetical protein n=1 Tax=Massilia sp. Leaf139 TaxID=1736272 RepID=UPI0006F6A724|nr:hypothetical protein [Massilia sp. Leaf139]KQQ86753.1 hypothetical protein ASF77_18815 [Massilia sp. Leaf139]